MAKMTNIQEHEGAQRRGGSAAQTGLTLGRAPAARASTISAFSLVLVGAAIGLSCVPLYNAYGDHAQRIAGQPLVLLVSEAISLILVVALVLVGKHSNRRLRESEQERARYKKLYDSAPAMLHSVSQDGTLVAVNTAWLKKTGYHPDEVLGRKFDEFLTLESRDYLQQIVRGRLAANGSIEAEPFQLVTKSGAMRDIQVSAIRDCDTNGVFLQMLASSVDVTQQVRVTAELEEQSELNRVILQSLGSGVVVTTTEDKVAYVNQAAEQLLGCTLAEAKNTQVSKWVTLHREPDAPGAEKRRLSTACAEAGRSLGRATLTTRMGVEVAVRGAISPLRGAGGGFSGAVFVLHDVSESRRLTEEMVRLARHDLLTGLPNRVVLQERVELACHQAERRDEEFGVLFLDLDRFKHVNDSLGHAVGDELLKEVAERLTACLRKGDTVCRMGGDEFVALLSGPTSEEAAIEVAEKIISTISEPYFLSAGEANVSASVGVARFPTNGTAPETLLKHADVAMYRAKREGRNRYKLFSRELDESATHRLQMESGLREALTQGAIEVHYQPQVNARTGEIVGVEALARWPSHEGPVGPDVFIPLAEECGLIIPLGYHVLRTACLQMKSWADQGLGLKTMAVNVSTIQLNAAGFVESVETVLRHSGLPGNLLELELTESALMEQPEHAKQVLVSLRHMGVRIALDDFGTGYSSLSYLKTFPVNTLKIDKSFVQDLTADVEDKRIVSAIIGLAKSMELNIVAEGVEDVVQKAELQGMNCDVLQGFLFSRPACAGAITALLREWQLVRRDPSDLKDANVDGIGRGC